MELICVSAKKFTYWPYGDVLEYYFYCKLLIIITVIKYVVIVAAEPYFGAYQHRQQQMQPKQINKNHQLASQLFNQPTNQPSKQPDWGCENTAMHHLCLNVWTCVSNAGKPLPMQ